MNEENQLLQGPPKTTNQLLHGDTTIKLSKETMRAIIENFLNANMPNLMVGCVVKDVSKNASYGDNGFEIEIATKA